MVGGMSPAVLRKHIGLLYASHHLDDAARARAAADELAGVEIHWQYRPLLAALRGWLGWRIRDDELERRRALVVKVRGLVSSGLRRDVDQAAALVADYYREAA